MTNNEKQQLIEIMLNRAERELDSTNKLSKQINNVKWVWLYTLIAIICVLLLTYQPY